MVECTQRRMDRTFPRFFAALRMTGKRVLVFLLSSCGRSHVSVYWSLITDYRGANLVELCSTTVDRREGLIYTWLIRDTWTVYTSDPCCFWTQALFLSAV